MNTLMILLWLSVAFGFYKIYLLQKKINKNSREIQKHKNKIAEIKKEILELEQQVNDPEEIKLFYGR